MKMQKVKMEVASGSSTTRRNSGRRCFCRLPVSIRQAWTDRNSGRRFYGCPRFPKGCNYLCWFDEDDGTDWQIQALLEARDEIEEKTRVIEQLTQTISEMKSNFEKKVKVDDENEDEIIRKFEEFYL
ncbi:hypothetical protein Bca52824_023916 [Brassica carinata]|uniref:GRF-type domain-containing protein n=1 Tax=Brassica carinata TaxID=52824 RepID=A0A8X7VJ56_BRACI|nr:hypothetical protein Bca52824_023916 [Brassica carinata]